MDKVFTFLMIATAMSLIFYVSGLSSGNDLNLIKSIISLTDTGDAALLRDIYIAIGIIAAAATIQSGLFGNASASIVLGSLSAFYVLITFVSDFLHILSIMPNHDVFYWIVWMGLSLFTIGYIWSLFDFIVGGD